MSHAFARRLVGGEPFFGHQAFDVFHDDDGVIHHYPDNEHHRKHGEHVDTHAERAHQGDRAQERDRDDDGRDEGVAQVLQEEEHHHEDERHRFAEGMQYLVDREADEGRGVVGRGPNHAFREVLRQLFHARLDRFGDGDGVTVVRKLHRHPGAGLAV